MLFYKLANRFADEVAKGNISSAKAKEVTDKLGLKARGLIRPSLVDPNIAFVGGGMEGMVGKTTDSAQHIKYYDLHPDRIGKQLYNTKIKYLEGLPSDIREKNFIKIERTSNPAIHKIEALPAEYFTDKHVDLDQAKIQVDKLRTANPKAALGDVQVISINPPGHRLQGVGFGHDGVAKVYDFMPFEKMDDVNKVMKIIHNPKNNMREFKMLPAKEKINQVMAYIDGKKDTALTSIKEIDWAKRRQKAGKAVEEVSKLKKFLPVAGALAALPLAYLGYKHLKDNNG